MEDALRDGRAEVGGSAGLSTDADITDEEAARQARELYRDTGIPPLAPDRDVEPYLADGEVLLGVRPEAVLGRLGEAGQGVVRAEGRLFVTDRRLLHLGAEAVSILLADVRELAISEDRILVTLAGSRGMTIDVPDPRHLRVLIAAARSAARG